MALTLKLLQGVTEVSFQAGSTGIQLASDGWQPLVSASGAPVIETMSLEARAASHNALATTLQALHDMQRWARAYTRDFTQTTPVWLYAQLNAETNPRRCLVYGDISPGEGPLVMRYASGWFGPESANEMASLSLALQRRGWWESVALTTDKTGAAISCIGGAFDYTASPAAAIPGDAPARLAKMLLATGLYSNGILIWLGFRSAEKHGTLANFVANWELDNGTVGIDTAKGADSNTVSTQAMITDFAGVTDWAERVKIELNDVTAHASDNYGRFVVILRARVGASTTCEVEVQGGYRAAHAALHEPVEVSEGAYHIFPVGVVTILSRDISGGHLSALDDTGFGFEIHARRTSGTGSLYLDVLTLIPADEYFMHIQCDQSATDVGVTVSPRGIQQALMYYSAGSPVQVIVEHGAINAEGDGLPIGSGQMYALMAGGDGLLPTATGTFGVAAFQAVARYHSLRGSG